MPVKIISFDKKDWAINASIYLQTRLDNSTIRDRPINFFLTGGKTASSVYTAWAELKKFQSTSGLNFYFGDERVVPLDSPESNYQMVMNSLFRDPLLASKHKIFPIDTDFLLLDNAARFYEGLLPQKIDFLLLTVGNDGHIASLFPRNPALKENVRYILSIDEVSENINKRITITPPFITLSEEIIVLAKGPSKRKILEAVIANQYDSFDLPAILASEAVWLTEDI